MQEEEVITEDQAAEALRELAKTYGSGADEEVDEAEVEQSVESSEGDEDTDTIEAAEGDEVEENDDLTSLRKRNEQLELDASTYESRLEATKTRHSQNEQILRERFLRKSTATDNALRILRQAQSEDGVAEAEVKRAIAEIEGTMNPASASYVAPQQNAASTEDQTLVINAFLNETGMTEVEASDFGNWINTQAATKMSPAEQAVAGSSLDGFVRLAHGHWRRDVGESQKETKRSDAVQAVKAVKRTQRAAANAASGAISAPKKNPASSAGGIDYDKLTPDDISTLVRQSVEAYK